MSWTQADADALRAAIARGEKRVQYADRSVEYRGVDEMLTALRTVEAELGAAADPPRPRQWHGYSAGKGA